MTSDDEAKNELGLPLCTEVDVNKKPSRASLYDTYQFILSDIEKAKDLMNNDDNIDYTELSSNVAKALEARVYLYMNRNQEALN